MAARLLALAVLAGMSTNLLLQLGMGLREKALDEKPPAPGAPSGNAGAAGAALWLAAFFVSVPLLWAAFSFLRYALPLGFAEYLLVFPVCLLVRSGWGLLSSGRLSGGRRQRPAREGPFADGALAGSALFVALLVADSFAGAAALSLGFALGALFASAAVAEIGRRARMEAVPRPLRGAPLALVAMGLLSLVLSSAAAALFEVLGRG